MKPLALTSAQKALTYRGVRVHLEPRVVELLA